jgi:capsular exopolysaccharide synthesis family protein
MGLFPKKQKQKVDKELLMTQNVPFSVEEAYKSLRTNIVFSLPEEKCKLIEITSAGQSEGKSVTAINLAVALAKNGAKVIVLDCDLRLPTIAKKLEIPQKPGLTNLLFGLNSAQEVIYHHEVGFDVIPAGELPPNPSETLGSSRMSITLDYLKNLYDYVILDAPPVCVVTDAAVLASKVSGVALVVRQGRTGREDVDAAISKLTIANGNILGFILTDCAEENT